MKHRPYSEWALEGGPRSAAEQQALAEHLRECDSCRELQQAWLEVRNRLQHAPLIAAPAGFGQRFMSRLSERKLSRQARHAWLIFAMSLVGSIGTMALLAYLHASRLAGGLANLVRGAVELSNQVSLLLELILHFLKLLPGPTGGIFGLSLLLAAVGGTVALFAGLGMLWTAAVYRFAYPSRVLGGRK